MIEIQSSLATQSQACGYAITYSLLTSPGLQPADPQVFTLTADNKIRIYTTDFAKDGNYNLIYRASLLN